MYDVSSSRQVYELTSVREQQQQQQHVYMYVHRHVESQPRDLLIALLLTAHTARGTTIPRRRRPPRLPMRTKLNASISIGSLDFVTGLPETTSASRMTQKRYK